MTTHRSAGAIVVSADLSRPETLLLDQVRHNGERQTVAPKGTIEADESPLLTAHREVREETGVSDLLYVGYLGQQRYSFTNNDSSPGVKSVDWFLFATDTTTAAPRVDEGFTAARWVALDQAAKTVTHESFEPFLERAHAIVEWRQQAPLAFSRTLSDLVWRYARDASAILYGETSAGVALCGSAARGDFVAGWSDIDLIGWGIAPSSPVARRLLDLTQQVEARYGIHSSLRLADEAGRDASGAGPLYDMKLRAAVGRTGIDVAVIAGRSLPPQVATLGSDLAEHVDFATTRLAETPVSSADRIDRTRRSLSVLCSAARTLATTLVSDASHRLSDVAALIDQHWPDTTTVRVLTSYDQFRRSGAIDLGQVEPLAEAVPNALHEMQKLLDGTLAADSSAGPTHP
jgi:8-oxo-dGTP pyrophosphatase MutT (NUDIX family)